MHNPPQGRYRCGTTPSHHGHSKKGSRHAKTILDLQARADETGALVGGYGVRMKNMILNTLTQEDGDNIAGIGQSNTRLNAYKTLMHTNGVFSELAK